MMNVSDKRTDCFTNSIKHHVYAITHSAKVRAYIIYCYRT